MEKNYFQGQFMPRVENEHLKVSFCEKESLSHQNLLPIPEICRLVYSLLLV